MDRDFAHVVVIGAGPAGVAAAVQLARYGIRPVVFERDIVGGLLRTAWFVENYPGFPRGICGRELAELMAEHLRGSGAELMGHEVASVVMDGNGLLVRWDGGEMQAGSVLVASGTRPRVPDEPELPAEAAGHVHYESRELWGRHGASIAIIGGGDAAFDYAIGLSESNRVTIFIRGSEARCLQVLSSRLGRMETADVRTYTSVTAVRALPDGRLELSIAGPEAGQGVRSVAGAAVNRSHETFDHLLFAIGRVPADSFLDREVLERSAELASANRLLYAGDVRSGAFRQASIASGLGTLAAMRIAAGIRPGDGLTTERS